MTPAGGRLGENVSAWEIESVVNQHPDVLESGAHAVKSQLGEDEVKVAIVCQPGADPKPESILDFCNGKMAHYAIPRYVEFVDTLPKTETRRIQYAALKAKGVTPEIWDRKAAGYKVEKVWEQRGKRRVGRGGACETSTSPESG